MRVATALVILLAGAAAASAAIVPQRGIAGVRLTMTRAQVRAVLGAQRLEVGAVEGEGRGRGNAGGGRRAGLLAAAPVRLLPATLELGA